MDDASLNQNRVSEILQNSNLETDIMDLDLDELLFDGCWLEATDATDSQQPIRFTPIAPLEPSEGLPSSEAGVSQFKTYSEKVYSQRDEHERVENHTQELEEVQKLTIAGQYGSAMAEGNELSRRWWIGPTPDPVPFPTVKDRLMWAINYLTESTRHEDILIQIWVPVKRGGKHVLTTSNQPFSLGPNNQSLASYRNVSENYQFEAEEDSKEMIGLPGRVFLAKVPEWTPDVRFFKKEEYPRIDYANELNVQGSLALPIFERGRGTCLGVVEIVTTTQKIKYKPELENICKALEAVDLRSSEILGLHKVKVCSESYKAALPDILELLASVSKTHNLPLAQTWAACVVHGESGCWNSEDHYAHCFSTISSACYLSDQKILGFHEACSEHHLRRGQGIVGRAFITNQPCFSADITSYRKADYPLSHHAMVFGLRAAVAIRIRSKYAGSVDFVLEFFLPIGCQESESQMRVLYSLSNALQQNCCSLYTLTDEVLQKELLLPSPEGEAAVTSDPEGNERETPKSEDSKKFLPRDTLTNVQKMDCQHEDEGVSVPLNHGEGEEDFNKTTWHPNSEESEQVHDFEDIGTPHQENGGKGTAIRGVDSSSSTGIRKPVGKKRTKPDKNISLQVLRQYFSGSLKDAAQSLGVCPTTLKRICRQHGITRWPSRKIKKVGHSLKKLQLVINSVEGTKGSIPISSFYSNFPELSAPDASGSGLETCHMIGDKSNELISQHDAGGLLHPFSSNQFNTQREGGFASSAATALKSQSTSCSLSSNSNLCCSDEAKEDHLVVDGSNYGDALSREGYNVVLKKAQSSVELDSLKQDEVKLVGRSQSHKSLDKYCVVEALPPSKKSFTRALRADETFRVKATFGEEKVRFSLQQNWGFVDFQQQMAKRFNIQDITKIHVKYLDDDSDWVLMTCDADLVECVDLHRLSKNYTIRLSLHQSSNPNLGSSSR